MSIAKPVCGIVALVVSGALSGCGGGGGGGGPPPPPPVVSYTVSGAVTGLSGTGLVLQNNGGNNLAVAANGSFTFTNAIANGGTFNVTVLSQPTGPSQACTVASGTGTLAGANVTNVAVNCVTGAFTVGATVNGLAGSGLVVINNGGDNKPLNTNGAFVFPTALASGGSYDIRIQSQPYEPNQSCRVTNARGAVTNAAITAPVITCVTQTIRFATSLDFNDASYSQYAVDPSTGQLRMRGYVPVDPFPIDLGATADGKFVYLLSRGAGSLHVFQRDSITGELTQASGSPALTGAIPSAGATPPFGAASVTGHPELNVVYVANGGGSTAANTIAAFAVNSATNAMTPVPGSPFAAGERPIKLAVDHTGRFAYLVNRDSRNIFTYTINQTSGALTQIGSPVPTGDIPTFPALHINGKFAYVPNAGTTGTISAYAINQATGLLTEITGSPFAAGANVTAPLLIHPSGKYLYLKSNPTSLPGAVMAFAIDQASGALSMIGSPVATDVNSQSVWLEPSGRYIFVANRGASLTIGSVSVLRIDPATGGLTSLTGLTNVNPAPYYASLDFAGNYLYTASAAGNVHRVYQFNFTSGALTPLPQGAEIAARDEPISLVAFASSTTSDAPVFRSRNAFVPNTGGGTIAAYSISSSGVLSATTGISPPTIATTGIQAVAVQPSGNVLLAVNASGNNFLSSYPINATSGALSAAAAAVAAGTNPVTVVADPSGRFAYVADAGDDTLKGFRVNATTGNLTALGSPSSTGTGVAGVPVALAMNPTGRFLYYLTDTQWGVRELDANTGAFLGGTSVAGTAGKSAITVHPGGRFAYIAIAGNPGSIEVYSINASGGAAGRLVATGASAATARDPVSIAIDPAGRYLYTANSGAGAYNISTFGINQQTGALIAVGMPIAAGNQPVAVRTDYSGKYLYAVSRLSNAVLAFTINPSTGALTPVAGTPVATGNLPGGLSLSEDIE